MVGVPIGVGVYARRRPPFERFGALLIVAGVGMVRHDAGRVVRPRALQHRAHRRLDRRAGARLPRARVPAPAGCATGPTARSSWAGVALVLRALPADGAPRRAATPSRRRGRRCHGDCPGNAFMVVDSEPALVDDVVRPLREMLTVRALRRGRRCASARRIRRATAAHAPHARAGPGRGRVPARWSPSRWRSCAGGSGPTRASSRSRCGWSRSAVPLMAWRVPARPLALAAVHRHATQRLAGRLRAHPPPDDLRAALAEAFDDRSLEIAYWLDGERRWGDAAGQPVRAPAPGVRPLVDRGPRRRAAGRDGHPRRRAPRRPRVHRRRDVVRGHHARQPPAVGADGLAPARGRRVAGADPARPPTTSAGGSSAICTTAPSNDSSRCGSSSSSPPRRPTASTPSAPSACAGWAPRSSRPSTTSARSHAASTRRRWPTTAWWRGAAVGGAADAAADDRARRRRRALPARGRERRVLLLPGGAAERGQARRAARPPPSSSSPTAARCGSRSATTARGSTWTP